MSKSFLFFFFIFLFSFASCFEMSVSPDELYLEGFTGKEICEEVLISVSKESTVLLEERWALEGYSLKILTSHNLSSKDLGIFSSFESKVEVLDSEKLEICFIPKEEGYFHGVILMKAEGTSVGVGTWINLNVSERKRAISGLVISNNSNKYNNMIIPFLVFLVLILFLIYFLVRGHNH